MLEKLGFNEIFNVIGGTSAWVAAEYDVERDTERVIQFRLPDPI